MHLRSLRISERHAILIVLWLAVAGLLSMAPGSASAAPQNGQVFKDWVVKCEGGEGQSERCYIVQNIVITQTGQRLLTFTAGYIGADSGPVAHLLLPLGMYLPAGVALKVDSGEQFKAPVIICSANGCEASLSLDDDLLPQLKNGLVAQVAFLDGTARRQITISVSLKGFTAAFNSLK